MMGASYYVLASAVEGSINHYLSMFENSLHIGNFSMGASFSDSINGSWCISL